MSTKYKTAQNPLILRCHRLMEAFAKSGDERDFYLDRAEGYLLFVDLDKNQQELDALDEEVKNYPDKYVAIPKLTFYESKKIMEGFVNEKVYDIDTKEKLLDIIQSKEARENFLEFLYDHLAELEKWQQYYQERARVRIIEWLRAQQLQFVFEEDLDLPRATIEKLKKELFANKVGRDLVAARKTLSAKAATYYSNEALNPRPKRGRPPKQVAKVENEPQLTQDFYSMVPLPLRPFLFAPDISSFSSSIFSSKFESERESAEQLKASKLSPLQKLDELSRKLASLRSLTAGVRTTPLPQKDVAPVEDEGDEELELPTQGESSKKSSQASAPKKAVKKKS